MKNWLRKRQSEVANASSKTKMTSQVLANSPDPLRIPRYPPYPPIDLDHLLSSVGRSDVQGKAS